MFDQDERLFALSQIHREALWRAVDFIVDRFQPTGILVAGTIIRGEGHLNSDLDFAVIHDKPWRQRVQRFENGVPCELFVNPPGQWRRTFMGEVATGRPAMLGIVSSGSVLHDSDGEFSNLVSLARNLMAQGPSPGAELLTSQRYAVASHFEDAVDLESIDLDRSNAFVVTALQDAARLRHLQLGNWLPREKRLFDSLAAIDTGAGALLRAVFEGPRQEWVTLAAPLVREIAETDRFFAWETAPQPVEP